MEIMSYFVPDSLKGNNFIISLHKQFEQKGKLSQKQINALEDILGIELDYYAYDITEVDEAYQEDYNLLLAKFKRNRFRSAKGRNKCIRAMQGIVDGNPSQSMIDDALGRNFGYRSYYRRW